MGKPNTGTYKKMLFYSAIAIILLVLSLPVVLKKYITTPHAASLISQLLSSTLKQTVAINSISISDRTLHLNGISLVGLDDAPQSKLLVLDSITIKPDWVTLLSGRKSFNRVEIDGIKIDLQRNAAGHWNFSRLLQLPSSKKPSSTELVISNLSLKNGTLQINQQQIKGVTLTISNLATKGSEKADVHLAFDDPGSNHYIMSGKTRFGKDAELDMSLTSSQVSLKNLAEKLMPGSRFLPENGKASLQLFAKLQNGLFQSRGEMPVNSVTRQGKAMNGRISFALEYDLQKDLLQVENVSVLLNDLLTIRAYGSAKEMKQTKEFMVDIKTDEVDLAKLAQFIPELANREITVSGKLAKSSLHLAGNAVKGITDARGKLDFSKGLLSKGKQLYFNDLTISAEASLVGNNLVVTGKAIQPQSTRGAVLESLNAPFVATTSRLFKDTRATLPALAAKVNGNSISGKADYFNRTLLLENFNLTKKDFSIKLGRLTTQLPAKQVSTSTVRYPVIADISNCDLKNREVLANNVSGKIRLTYAYNPDSKWLEGTTSIKAEKISWDGKESGIASFDAVFTEAGGKADFKATLLGGSTNGTLAFNPFALSDKTTFSINLQGIQLSETNRLTAKKEETSFTSGTMDAIGKGNYSLSNGLSGHINATGKSMTITGKSGKTILSDGGIEIDSEITGNKLILHKTQFSVGKNITSNVKGAIDNVFMSERQGRLTFTVPKTAVADLTDSFINTLPRQLQEATIDGLIAAEGAVNLKQGSVIIDGSITLTNINIDAPSHKIKLVDINGVLPLSLDLMGKTDGKLPLSLNFSRQNYDNLLKQLRQPQGKVETINIGNSTFSGINIDSAKFSLQADHGVTKIISLDSSLYGGTILGKGFLTIQKGLVYRGDLLFNNLSLVQICKAFPAINGYLSGKTDGIISVRANGNKSADLAGFTEFWARETADEKMLVSKEFLQKLSGKKLSGFFFSSDRAFDHAGIKAALENGFLTFDSLDISHTNLFGVKDLSVTIATSQNRIAIDHLLNSIKEATVRGKGVDGEAAKEGQPAAPPAAEFKWDE